MLRLSELLERLRPAGTPGAPTEGEQQRHQELLEHEIAGVTAVLGAFESEAERLIAVARSEAERIREDGERRAGLIRAQLPGRIAIARAEAVRVGVAPGEDQIARVRREADDVIAQIETRAATRIPELVDGVVETIWSTVPSASSDPGHRSDRMDRP